jgi:hypothetical protein
VQIVVSAYIAPRVRQAQGRTGRLDGAGMMVH